MIELEGRVISVISGSESPDGKQRIAVKVTGASFGFDVLRIPNECEHKVDDSVCILVIPTGGVVQAREIDPEFLDAMNNHGQNEAQ